MTIFFYIVLTDKCMIYTFMLLLKYTTCILAHMNHRCLRF
jgi:hypothetical protein